MNDLRLMTGIVYYDVEVPFPFPSSFPRLRVAGEKSNTYLVTVEGRGVEKKEVLLSCCMACDAYLICVGFCWVVVVAVTRRTE